MRRWMGSPSSFEDAFERWVEDGNVGGGMVGPAGGPTVPPFVPPLKPGPLASVKKRKRTAATPGEEFGGIFRRLRSAVRFLLETFDEMAGENGWQVCLRRAEVIYDKWAHLSADDSEPRPKYEDFLSIRQAY